MAAQHALILAGGQSRRFGSDKTALRRDGRLVLAHLVCVFRATGHEVSILGPQNEHLSSLGCRILQDPAPYEGAMAAIAAAMDVLACESAFVAAADMPFLNPRIVMAMWNALGNTKGVVLEGAILPVIYRNDAIFDMKSLMEKGEKRLGMLQKEMNSNMYVIPRDTWSALDPRGWSVHNINHPEDWKFVIDEKN